MLFLLDKDVRTVKWNGIPLHEASSAIVKEEINGDFTLSVRYPITDSGIYRLIKSDMLIKAPTPVLGAQLFRIKKPIENDDSLDITAYHVSDDIMKRSIKPVSVVGQGCAMALSQMVQNAKTGLGDFSFTSDIMDSRTFNTTETRTLYSVLMDGKHSIVGTWEGELVRDNFALSIKRSRGADRGVVITTHKNLKSYQRTKNSQNVVTRIHARSTFKPEGAEEETKLSVTVDSPLINSYPYINEKEYENNNARTTDELRKWAEAKFKNEGIDKVSDAIEIEAYELDGQVVHLGDTVNLKSRKHSADLYKKAIAYEFNALTEEYISITFDDKPGVGGHGVSSGLSNVANAILEAGSGAQSLEISRAIANANQAFDAEFEKRLTNINDEIERVKSDAQVYADSIRQDINQQFDDFNESYETEQAKQDQAVKEVLDKALAAENLAGQAKSISDQAKADAIAEANRLVASARQSLDGQLAQQAQQLLTQASAQEQLTRRTSAVEQLANSTKTTLTELSKTVTDQTGQIVSVSERTKTVEDGIAGLTTRYDNLSVGGVNLAVVAEPSGYYNNNGVFTKSDSYRATELIAVEDAQYLLQSWFPGGSKSNWVGLVYFDANQRYIANTYQSIPGIGEYDKRIITPTNAKYVAISYKNGGKVQLEKGVIGSDYRLPDATIQKQLAEYHQSASENYAKLSETVQTAGNKIIETETLVKQTAKGLESRLTATQVNSLIDGKGFATTQTVQNIAKETAGSFERQIIETKGLIPDKIGGVNLLLNSSFEQTATTTTFVVNGQSYNKGAKSWFTYNDIIANATTSYHAYVSEFEGRKNAIIYNESNGSRNWKGIQQILVDRMPQTTNNFILSLDVFVTGAGTKLFGGFYYADKSGSYNFYSGYFRFDTATFEVGKWQRVSIAVPFEKEKADFTKNVRFYIYAYNFTTNAILAIDDVKLETGKIATDHGLAPEELVTETKFNTVKDTVDQHQQIIGDGTSISQAIQSANKFERSIVSGGDIYQAIETAKGLLQEVTGANGLKTQMSQLAGSWAVKNLTSAGTVLNQINLMANGTNRIDGRLTHITGQTLIDNAVIKSAMIDKLKTANFESGSVTAAILASNSVTADKLVVDQALFNKLMANEAYLKQLFAKSAFITQVQSVTMSANQISGGSLRSLNGATEFNLQTGDITFMTNDSILKRVQTGYPTQFIRFVNDLSNTQSTTVIGSSDYDENPNGATFTGIRMLNGRSGRSQLDINANDIYLRNSPASNIGFCIDSSGQVLMPIQENRSSKIYSKEFYIDGYSLSYILDRIFDNFRNLNQKGDNYARNFYPNWR
ncbi:phage tail spike protein [Streptococcus pluranimalium]